MEQLDPRIKKIRSIGIGIFIALSVAAVPIAVHIIKTRSSPELWLTLLGAVFMMVLICLYALETALAPIPQQRTTTPLTASRPVETVIQNETLLDEPPEISAKTEMMEPSVGPLPSPAPQQAEGASLVEVEEVHTHPPYPPTTPALGVDLAEADTELDLGRATNPDGPVMTVPNSSLRSTDVETSPEDERI
jgi:hypothetical protein